MLLASLNPAAVAAGADLDDAVRIDGVSLSRSDLVGAATSVAERVGGASRVAVLATPTAATVLAVTGCLIAGVPVVPVPADVGEAERRHILTDSGAQAWLGELPEATGGLPHVPVRLHARSWHRYAEPSPDAAAMIVAIVTRPTALRPPELCPPELRPLASSDTAEISGSGPEVIDTPMCRRQDGSGNAGSSGVNSQACQRSFSGASE